MKEHAKIARRAAQPKTERSVHAPTLAGIEEQHIEMWREHKRLDRQIREIVSLAKNALRLAHQGYWELEIVPVVVNILSHNIQAGSTPTQTIPGLHIGDYCFWSGQDPATDTAGVIVYCAPPLCSVEETIQLQIFNADDAIRDPANATHYFTVWHRISDREE